MCKEGGAQIYHLTCMVWVFPLLVTPYAKIVPVIKKRT